MIIDKFSEDGKIGFNAETHTYWNVLTGEEYISVSKLLQKHGLTKSYAGVKEDTLRFAAEKGTMIHEEIANYINNHELSFIPEVNDFAELCGRERITPMRAEYIVYNDEYKVAGTVDFDAIQDGDYILGDNKTTATVDKPAYSWSLSLYAFMDGRDIRRIFISHLRDGAKAIYLNKVPTEEIIALLEAEKNGKIYKREVTFDPTMLSEIADAETLLRRITAEKEEAEKRYDALKECVKKVMEEQHIEVFENEAVRIKYTAPTTRATLDSKALTKDLPEIAEKYTRQSEVKSRVTITLR